MTEDQVSTPMYGEPANQVSGPSVGLLVTGIVGAVFAFISLVGVLFGTSITALTGLRDEWAEDIPGWYEGIWEGSFAIGSTFIELVVAGFIIYAALKMKELQQWGLVVAACILAMIPCISPCCILGLPIGIWCLVILMRPEVKDAFK